MMLMAQTTDQSTSEGVPARIAVLLHRAGDLVLDPGGNERLTPDAGMLLASCTLQAEVLVKEPLPLPNEPATGRECIEAAAALAAEWVPDASTLETQLLRNDLADLWHLVK